MAADLKGFLEAQSLAVVGVSRNKTGFGRYALQSLRARGFEVFAVNAQADELDGEPCYRSLAALPKRVDGVVAVVAPEAALQVLEDCARLGLRRVWLQQGAESHEALARARALGLEVVSGACVLMYLKPTGFHAFHGWLSRSFSRELGS